MALHSRVHVRLVLGRSRISNTCLFDTHWKQVRINLTENTVLYFSDATDTGLSYAWQNFLGVAKLSRTPDYDVTAPIFTPERLLIIFVYLAILIQRRINASIALYYVVRHVKQDTDMSWDRAQAYREKKIHEIAEEKYQYEEEVRAIRNKVIVSKNYQKEVQDWINLFGRRDDDVGYAIVGPVYGEDGERVIDWDILEIDDDDRFHFNGPIDEAKQPEVMPSVCLMFMRFSFYRLDRGILVV